MITQFQSLLFKRREHVVLAYTKPLRALLLMSCLCCLMIVVRWIRMDSMKYGFLIWNLFLAWIPLIIAYWIQLKKYPYAFFSMPISVVSRGQKFGFIVLFTTWLLFFPNAPYIISDLMHLKWNKGPIIWFDAGLFFCFAFAGLQLGMLSLVMIQKSLEKTLGRWVAWHIVAASIWLSGLGIYMGRELRINTWDVLMAPHKLIEKLINEFSIHALNMTIMYADKKVSPPAMSAYLFTLLFRCNHTIPPNKKEVKINPLIPKVSSQNSALNSRAPIPVRASLMAC